MITCRTATVRISRRLEEELDWPTAAGLGLHLLACYRCRRFNRQVSVLRKAFRSLGSETPPPPSNPTKETP